MMNCKDAPGEQLLLDYLSGELSDDEAVKLEEHYFTCPSCLKRVEALQDVQLRLRAEPRELYRKPIPWPIRFATIGAIAAVALATVFALYGRHPGQQRPIAVGGSNSHEPGGPTLASGKSPSVNVAVSQLADLTLPVFQMPRLRGEHNNADFKSGMTDYMHQNCPSAIKTLSRVPDGDRDLTAARFYSAVCLMKERDFAGASARLRSVAEAGDSPQQEAALYYLAQVFLENGDIANARRNLTSVLLLRGDFEDRARSQLARLPDGDLSH